MLVALVIGMPLYVCTTATVPIAAAGSQRVSAGRRDGVSHQRPGDQRGDDGRDLPRVGRADAGEVSDDDRRGERCVRLVVRPLDRSGDGAPTHMHEHHSWWATACAGLLVALLAWFAGSDPGVVSQGGTPRRRRSQAGGDGRTVEVAVSGMTCAGLRSKLERVLGREAGVSRRGGDARAGPRRPWHQRAAGVRDSWRRRGSRRGARRRISLRSPTNCESGEIRQRLLCRQPHRHFGLPAAIRRAA